MRAINTLKDAAIVLQELYNWKDRLTSAPWDFKGLRITNASPSKDPNDYVIRKELPQIQGSQLGKKAYYTIPFSNEGQITIGNDVSPHYIVPIGGAGTLVKVYIYTVIVDIVDITVDVILNGVPVLSTPIRLPVGQHGPVSALNFTQNIVISEFDTIGLNVYTGSVSALLSVQLRVLRNPIQ
jgi:hypothetical protein